VPHDILRVRGAEAVRQYLVREVQAVYRSRRVDIDDKHSEIIISQALRKVRVEEEGNIVTREANEEARVALEAEGKEAPTPAVCGSPPGRRTCLSWRPGYPKCRQFPRRPRRPGHKALHRHAARRGNLTGVAVCHLPPPPAAVPTLRT
jgi:hypothetical protein